jgi:hypothetical protein
MARRALATSAMAFATPGSVLTDHVATVEKPNVVEDVGGVDQDSTYSPCRAPWKEYEPDTFAGQEARTEARQPGAAGAHAEMTSTATGMEEVQRIESVPWEAFAAGTTTLTVVAAGVEWPSSWLVAC